MKTQKNWLKWALNNGYTEAQAITVIHGTDVILEVATEMYEFFNWMVKIGNKQPVTEEAYFKIQQRFIEIHHEKQGS